VNVQPSGLSAVVRDLVARADPMRPALSTLGEIPMSFGDLDLQVDAVGRTLRACGIGSHDVVVVVLPNGPVMAAAFLGVAAHAICAPLNPQYSAEEFAFYLEDLAAKAIMLPAGLSSVARVEAQKLGLHLLEVETITGPAGAFRIGGCDVRATHHLQSSGPDDIALILHTSGTTTRPKIVPLSHRNLCASAAAVVQSLALVPTDVSLIVMPLFHIHGLVGVLLSSMHAGGSVLCTGGFDAERFPDWLTKGRVTWYSAVPTIHQSVLESVRGEDHRGNHELRFIRSSSASLAPAVMAALEHTFEVPVIEAYGMTEAAHQMASNPLPPGIRKPGSVGRAAGPEVGVMNETGAMLPTGATGEVVIRGPGVTPGYLDNAEANGTSFCDGWFRTGDQGFFRCRRLPVSHRPVEGDHQSGRGKNFAA